MMTNFQVAISSPMTSFQILGKMSMMRMSCVVLSRMVRFGLAETRIHMTAPQSQYNRFHLISKLLIGHE